MAVTINVVKNQTGAAVTTITVTTIAIAANANRVAHVGITWADVLTAGDPATLTSVTGAGGVGVFIQAQVGSGAGGNSEEYYILNPDSGSQSVTATWTGGAGISVLGDVHVVVMDNVNQVTPIGATAALEDFGTAILATLGATVSGSMLVDDVSVDNIVSGTATVDAAQTEDVNVSVGSVAQGRKRFLGSHRSSPGGAIDMKWTLSAAHEWDDTAVEYKEAPATSLQDPILSPGLVPFPR